MALWRGMSTNAMESGDLFSGKNPYDTMEVEEDVSHGRVMDLVLPIVLLILCCVTGMLYSGGFFDGVGFVEAFSASDASVGAAAGVCLCTGLLLDLLWAPPLHVV